LFYEEPVPIPRLVVPADAATPALVKKAKIAADRREHEAKQAVKARDDAWDVPQRALMSDLAACFRTAAFVTLLQGRYLDTVPLVRRFALQLPLAWPVLCTDIASEWAAFRRIPGMENFCHLHVFPLIETCLAARAAATAAIAAAAAVAVAAPLPVVPLPAPAPAPVPIPVARGGPVGPPAPPLVVAATALRGRGPGSRSGWRGRIL